MTEFIAQLAAEHNVQVVMGGLQGAVGVEGMTGPDRTIFLDPNLFPPRMNFRFCHELAHVLLGHVDAQNPTPEMEHDADELASELLLPSSVFRLAARRLDLKGLKDEFPHASWEAIGRKLLDVMPAVLTIWDDRKLTRRIGSPDLNFPSKPTRNEKEIADSLFEGMGDHATSRSPRSRITSDAWFVDEGTGVKRVVMITQVEEE